MTKNCSINSTGFGERMLSPRLRVMLFFARSPHDEELSTADIAVKFDLDPMSVYDRLRVSRLEGWLSTRLNPAGGNRSLWRAGPALRKECGMEDFNPGEETT